MQYYLTLRSILRTKPHLRPCLVRCRHCGIYFLTSPSNRGRKDLRCPFGCRQAYRKNESSRRSQEYYRSQEGREKKRQLNRNRSLVAVGLAAKENRDFQANPHPNRLTSCIVGYVRLVVSLIEGRWLSWEEVWELINKILRQHSLERQRRIDYAVGRLNKEPP